MWLIDKKYEFFHDGRKLEIIVKLGANKNLRKIDEVLTKIGANQNFISLIEWLWKNSNGAKRHSIIRFILVRYLPGFGHTLMEVPPKEAILGNVYVSTDDILQAINGDLKAELKDPEKFVVWFLSNVEHEITHLYQHQKNVYLKMRETAKEMLKLALRRIDFDEKTGHLPVLRLHLFIVIRKFQTEGTANY